MAAGGGVWSKSERGLFKGQRIFVRGGQVAQLSRQYGDRPMGEIREQLRSPSGAMMTRVMGLAPSDAQRRAAAAVGVPTPRPLPRSLPLRRLQPLPEPPAPAQPAKRGAPTRGNWGGVSRADQAATRARQQAASEQAAQALAAAAAPARTATTPGVPGTRDVARGLHPLDGVQLVDWATMQGRSASKGNPALTALVEAQGFRSKPTVVDKAAMDALVRAGHEELFRGVRRNPQSAATTDAIVEQLRTGDAHMGKGIYGDGIYFSGAGAGGAQRREALAVTRAFMTENDGATASGRAMRAVLRADAAVAEYDQILKDAKAWHAQTIDLIALEARSGRIDGATEARMLGVAKTIAAEPTYWAALHGYDAVRVPVGYDTGGIDQTTGMRDPGQLVVLNRSAVVVQGDTFDYGAMATVERDTPWASQEPQPATRRRRRGA